MIPSFKERVLAIVRQIPEGKTVTYAQVAAMAGSPGAFRAVGSIMSKNFDPAIPCHRVIRTDGKMGGYNRGGIERKIEILNTEKKL
jgi:methylated-DNA-[protein]-cysteine S-methyltransferase